MICAIGGVRCKCFERKDILTLHREEKSLHSEMICSLQQMVIELDIQMQKTKSRHRLYISQKLK